MSNTVISIENVSKSYQLGVIGTGTFYGDLKRWWAKKRGRPDPFLKIGEKDHGNRQGETLWALKDINFQVQQGEVLGIIGRNGAGKSTLLKILSRVTAPTSGEIKVKGRIASLLEVGTGFHPELTGRENIFLNGAILGMNRREIQHKFDEIVDFSGVEPFIDTPVKRYSSGMYIRLAFAVAAHLEPDILIVDEVLAVGDAEFQKKCLGKMGEVAIDGRTVIFVSHNMGAVQQLCPRAMLLNKGTVFADDIAGTVISEYLTMGLEQKGERVWPDINQAPGDEVAHLRAVRILNQHGKVCTSFDVRDPVFIQMEYSVLQDTSWFNSTFYLYNERGELVLVLADNTTDTASGGRPRLAGLYRSTCKIPLDFLNDGQYYVQVNLTDEIAVHTIQRDVLMFHVSDAMDASGVRGNYNFSWARAAVRPKFEWNMEYFRSEEIETINAVPNGTEKG